MDTKKYFYNDNEQWLGEFSYNELKQRNIPTTNLIWYNGLCPNGEPPERCRHIVPFSKLIEQYEPTPVLLKQNRNATLLGLGLIALVFLLFFVFIFTRPVNKKKETVIVEIEIPIIKSKLRTTYETQYYEIQKQPNPELVKGLKGDYYIINLKNAVTNERILFKVGEYFIDDFNEQFITSLNKFMTEIYSKIDSGVDCQIFVKGSADILGQGKFKRQIDKRYGTDQGFTKIEYYKGVSSSDYLFLSEFDTETIDNEYTNSNLPNLRGKFFQFKISQSYRDIKSPIILEGRVKREVDSTLRNTNLILFVNWDKKTILTSQTTVQ